MLGKLIKHEFRASGRIMWPAFLAMTALTFFIRIGDTLFPDIATGNWMVQVLIALLMIGFGLGMMAMLLAPPVLSATRFHSHVLKDEGYLTLTLPVNAHQLLASHLIVSAIWYVLSFCMFIAIITILVVSDLETLGEFMGSFVFDLIRYMRENAPAVRHALLVLFELLVNWIFGVTLVTLAVYAAYAIGQSFRRHKKMWTTLLVLAFMYLVQYTGIVSLINIADRRFDGALGGVKTVEWVLFASLLGMAAMCALFYTITWYFITRKLNLE